VHVAIEDATRLAYMEVLTDEQQATAIGFVSRAVAWFNGQGVESHQLMSDKSPAYRSRCFAKACRLLGLKHILTRPYTPLTNGKAERFIQSLWREWAYSISLQNSDERNRWLPRYLAIYNQIRQHSALGGKSP
jgi:transposase InsO family protein